MKTKCLCCLIRDVSCKKRQLCQICYSRLYVAGRIEEYPILYDVRRTLWFEKHGANLINDLMMLMNKQDITLENIGNKHGLSRERIRQLFETFYGFKYTVVVKSRTNTNKLKKDNIIKQKRDPRNKVKTYKRESGHFKGATSEKKVFDICASLGYEIRPSESNTIDLIINGYGVEIKSAHKTTQTAKANKTPQYHFQLLESQNNVDFVVCHAVPINKFFIIPRKEYPPGRHLYLPSSNPRHGSKYYDYLEAWHLLKPASAVIFNMPNMATA